MTIDRRRITGWREWVGLPALGVTQIKAKLDTGARTSALHAFDMETFWRDEELWVRFSVHPFQRDDKKVIACESAVEGIRTVTNPGGRRQKRLLIRTDITLGDETWPMDLSLTDRDEMGFRLLIGRTAMHRNLIVDPDRSYRVGKRKRTKKKKIPKAGLKVRTARRPDANPGHRRTL